MRASRIAWGVACLLVTMALPAYCQQAKGDNELQFQGGLSLATSSHQQSDSGSATLEYGRFITDLQEVGAKTTVSIFGDHQISGSGGLFYRYNFSTSKVVPYLGVGVDSSLGGSGSAASFGKGALATGAGGVRYFLDRATAFTVEGSTFYSFDAHAFSKQLLVTFGFSHLWR